jgi:crotonobetainyl-CoA:carnitine CoA-transferase CaiB-like acyl-CoA transferase
MGKDKLPLEGIKVADFSQAGVAPIGTKMLADYGATVIKLETHTRPDILRTVSPFKGQLTIDGSAFFANWNTGKYSISINLRKPQGKNVALKLIAWADIVVENFAPGAMERLGLDYESVKEIKPDIIYWAICQLGHTGPWAKYRGYGHQSAALAGVWHLSGWPDRKPSPPFGAYTDETAPYIAVTYILASLAYRRRTGKGIYLDQSMAESMLKLFAPLFMDYWVNGTIACRDGNRLSSAAPHGVYQCKGEERWVSIAVFNDDEWSSFCSAIDKPQWIKEKKYKTLLERKKNENELNKCIEEYTIENKAEEIEKRLQAENVCAHVVQAAPDLFNDPQLNHRQHFVYIDHPVIGKHACDAPSGRLSKTPYKLRSAPMIGQHNEYVLKDVLGLSDDEIMEMLIEGVITTDDDLPDYQISVN